jgi:predicted dehydrogenase
MVADLDPGRLHDVRQTFPSVETTTDYRQLLGDRTDAIVVATPVSTHHGIAREALLNGKHVMVEKPLANTSEGAADLVDISGANDLRLMVGHVFEYNPAVERLREIIQSGEIGDVLYIDMVRATLGLFQRDINVIWDLAPHDFSILKYILGQNPVSVSARGESYVRKGIHDVAYITANFPQSIQAHIRVSWLEPRKQRHMTVVGSKKMVVYDDVEPVEKLKIYDMGVDFEPGDPLGAGQLRYRYGDIVSPRLPQIEPLQAECSHFIQSIVDGAMPRSGGPIGLDVVHMLELADTSLHDNGALQLANHTFKDRTDH